MFPKNRSPEKPQKNAPNDWRATRRSRLCANVHPMSFSEPILWSWSMANFSASLPMPLMPRACYECFQDASIL
jgi:hypothetical protein